MSRLVVFALSAAFSVACAQADEDEVPLPADGGVDPRDGAVVACGSPVDCGDDNPCTDDRCEDGVCRHVPMEAGSPCRDNDLCNGEEACDADGVCQAGTPVQCELAGLCVTSTCDPETGMCVDHPKPDCCEGADCPGDAGPDASVPLDVGVPPDAGPPPDTGVAGCSSADDCPAGPCERALCGEDGTCSTEPVAECCLHDGDCPAGPCASALCSPGTNTCEETPIAGCCTADADCPAGQTCDLAAGACVNQPLECCEIDADCGQPDACLIPRCGGPEVCCMLERVPGCCTNDAECGPAERCDVATNTCAAAPVEFASVQFPVEPLTLCAGDETPLLFGRVYLRGVTPGAGQGAGVEAQAGFGPAGTRPEGEGWSWRDATYNSDLINGFGELNDDEYRAVITFEAPGDHEIAWRFRTHDTDWVYGDLPPEGSTNGYDAATALVAHVNDCAGIPVDYAAFQHPLEPIELCAGDETPLIFGRVYAEGVTPGPGAGEGIAGDLGWGPAGTAPDDAAWQWVPGAYNGDLMNEFGDVSDDEWRAVLAGLPEGTWALAWRFSLNDGPPTYGDLPPEGSLDGFETGTTLVVTVSACGGP